jgi:hypothetical protein
MIDAEIAEDAERNQLNLSFLRVLDGKFSDIKRHCDPAEKLGWSAGGERILSGT